MFLKYFGVNKLSEYTGVGPWGQEVQSEIQTSKTSSSLYDFVGTVVLEYQFNQDVGEISLLLYNSTPNEHWN